MKTKILTILLLISGAVYSQVDRNDRKVCQKLAKGHIKSMVQIDYPYVYDMNSGSSKPSTTGTKVESQTYDLKGNPTQDIVYDDYGNVSTKTVSKYDTRGNAIENVVYNSDGTINLKGVIQYNKDTITLLKVYNPDGTINNVKYTKHWHERHKNDNANSHDTNSNTTAYHIIFYNQKDSSLISGTTYVYDDAGDLVFLISLEAGTSNDLVQTSKEGWKYNQKHVMVEHDSYHNAGDDNDVTAWEFYKYDENGNEIEIENRSYSFVYKNDAKGLPISAIKYDNSNNPARLTKWTYTYYQ